MKRLLLAALCATFLVLSQGVPVQAEEVYVGNRPFQGAVSGTGTETYVDARTLAKALGLEFKQAGDVWIAGGDPAPEGTPAGSAVFAGQVVPCRLDRAGQPLVHLQSAAEAAGAVMRVNRQMGCIDVNRPVARVVPQAPRRQADVDESASAPTGPILLNKGNPGGEVDVEKKLVPGRINVVDFYADWCGPCQQLAPQLEALAAQRGLALLKVDIANWGSPVAEQYNIRSVPHLVIYDKFGKKVAEGLQESMDYLQRL